MQIAGGVLVGMVALQLLLAIYSSLRRLRGNRLQQRLGAELLKQQIDAANALRVQREKGQSIWNGYRKFVVDRKFEEADNVVSVYMVPHDRKPLPSFKPGQYLTFRLSIPGQEKPTIRCYSLSDSPNKDYYRITVKRVPPPRDKPEIPAGLVSNFMHDGVDVGDILDVQAPGGHFFIDPMEQKPAVFIAGGVGITPFVSMANAVAEMESGRQIWLFYGVRNQRDYAMKQNLEALAREYENFHFYVCFSSPGEGEVKGRDYHYKGRINVDLLKEVLGSNNYEFYMCGPPPMMSGVRDALIEWKVPKNRIITEAFGASTVDTAFSKARKKAAKPKGTDKSAKKASVKVKFDKSGKSCVWNEECGNLLDFAIENGISIDSGCRAGNCATCVVAIKSGKINYVTECGAEPEEGSCLTCIAVPEDNLVLDA